MSQLSNLSLGPVNSPAVHAPVAPPPVRVPVGVGAHSGSAEVAGSAGPASSARKPLVGTTLGLAAEAPTPETVALTVYQELRAKGFSEQQVIALAGELLSLVTADVRRQGQQR